MKNALTFTAGAVCMIAIMYHAGIQDAKRAELHNCIHYVAYEQGFTGSESDAYALFTETCTR